MGVLTRGILGGFRGSVGPVTGTSWKGIDVIKSKPLSVANPRSPAQTAQRTKFAAVVAMASAILVSTIKPLWDRFAQRESGYNAFVSANIDEFDANGDIANPQDLRMSIGTWSNISNLGTPSYLNTGQISFVYDANGGLATDELYGVMYNATTGLVQGATATTDRGSEDAEFNFAQGWESSDNLFFFYMTRRADGTAVSNSAFIERA